VAKPLENIIKKLRKWLCKYLGLWCEDIELGPPVVNNFQVEIEDG
jgi:hypothetical protein